jgi:hypothetical protein
MGKKVDVQKALLNPMSIFNDPMDVVRNEDITRDQKIKILRRWEYDARELQVAEEENMTGPDVSKLDLVLNALNILDAKIDRDHSAPNKQGGE